MELLSNDLKLIVYKSLHSDMYRLVRYEFVDKHVRYWNDLRCCYVRTSGGWSAWETFLNGRNLSVELLPKGNRYVIFDIYTGYTSRKHLQDNMWGHASAPIKY